MKSIAISRCDSLIIRATLTIYLSVLVATSLGQQQPQQLVNIDYDNNTRQDNKVRYPSNEHLNLIEADDNGLYLVGLFDIHQSNPRTPFKCGKIDLDSGESQSRRPMQNMEAFLWAIEQVNSDKNLLPGIKLGSLVMNTCSSFLRTNQQMANLLHGQLTSKLGQQVPSLRQIMAVVADNSDYPSIEAVVSMASALGITTFVTQSRSSKLSELARKYTTPSVVATSNQVAPNSATFVGGSGNNQDNAILRMISLQAPPSSVEETSNSDYSRESFQRRFLLDSAISPSQQPSISSSERKRFEGMLSELIGIGKMTTSSEESNLDNMMPMSSGSSDTLLSAISGGGVGGISSGNFEEFQRQQKLLMVKMLLGNELIADSLASLMNAMQWDFVSVVYDDELDMIDLHDELVRILYNRNIQLALDEQIPFGSTSDVYDKLLQNLTKKSTYGARVVLTLLGTGSARVLLDSLRHFRSLEAGSKIEQVSHLNSLIWITVSDREPYYSFATDALGTVTISSAVSLIPEFKTYYDRLVSEEHASINRWWPEYMKAILLKHQKDIELISNECSKWLEPRLSPLQERCRSLTLTSLVQYERSANHLLLLNNTKSSSNSNGSTTKPLSNYNKSKLSKYLANGWDHNGMDVINSVLAAANGLESIRQALCPDQAVGICARMRELVQPTSTTQQVSIYNNNNNNESNNNNSDNNSKSNNQMDLPMLSELIYSEMSRSTFQLADGRMFNLEDDFNSNSLGQVEGKLKLYNLRYLQPNSIGFVKFGSFDRQDGLLMNSSKALHYTNNDNFVSQVPIENVKSTCQDESKCLMLSSYEMALALNKQEQEQQQQQQSQQSVGSGAGGSIRRGISEEELASGVNSLFKLDHPFIMSPQSSNNHHRQFTIATGELQSLSINQSQIGKSSKQIVEDSHIQIIRAFPALNGLHFNWNLTSSAQKEQQQPQRNVKTFNAIVLLPLHKGYQSSNIVESSTMASSNKCSEQMDIEHSFQHLVALSYAQNQLANSQQELQFPSSNGNNFNSNQNNRNGQLVEPQIELTTTVIDYCEQSELASSKLAVKLEEAVNNSIGSSVNKLPLGDVVAVIDFDSQISENISKLVSRNGLLHLSIGSENGNVFDRKEETLPSTTSAHKDSNGEQVSDDATHLRVSLLPSKRNEIEAIVKLISAMNQWKLVHLIYTDHHHYRDEFVRRANEANICVSKLIWIPTLAERGEMKEEEEKKKKRITMMKAGKLLSMLDDKNNVFDKTTADQMKLEKFQQHLDKTKQLFSQELHDYSSPSSSKFSTTTTTSRQQNSFENNAELHDDEHGLNNTRVLVVLASENDSTNQMILEAASQSMLDDYIWVTSHEWLNSVELPRELHRQQKPALSASSIESAAPTTTATNNKLYQQQQLPKYFVSTRLETFESNDFKRYFSNLSPSIHSPVPTNWFDQFWQQNFQCKLPISNPLGGVAAAPSGTASTSAIASAPVCKSNEHLDLHNIIEDDKVHYTILAIESLHAALEAAQNLSIDTRSKDFASIFKLTFDKSRHTNQPVGSEQNNKLMFDNNRDNNNDLLNNKFAKLPYGFHFVHRLLPPTAPPVEETGDKKRRQNSRTLSHDSHQQPLLKVGLWRDGQLILLKKFNNNTYNNLRWLNNKNSINGYGEEDGGDMNIDQMEIGSAISKSLAKLASIRSKCSPKNGQTCKLCQRQIEQTIIQIKQEEIRLLQSQSINEPKAISSILYSLNNKSKQSILDVTSSSSFDDNDYDENIDEQQSQADDTNSKDYSSSSMRIKNLDNDIEISASSLFDSNTQRQVEQQRRVDIQRSYNHMLHSNREQSANRWKTMRSIQPSMNLSGVLMSLLSVLGIVCVVSSMAYFYPNMLVRKDKPQCSIAGDVAGSFYTNCEQGSKLGLGNSINSPDESSSLSSSIPPSNVVKQSTIDNINDYFLLTGLLMLYSINIAFLLPATFNVCWFRRMGLASGYTMVFSAILVKILSNYRQSLRQKLNIDKLQLSSSYSSENLHQQQQQQMRSQHQVIDPTEDSVEVTFESLPPEQVTTTVTEPNQPIQQSDECCSTVDQLTNAYQTSPQNNFSDNNQKQLYSGSSSQTHELPWIACKNPTLLTILIGLILGQFMLSIIWLFQQPPEPTLFYSCWRCASPSKSPILFLYEPLLSLLYPASILVFGWIWAIFSFKLASGNEEKYRLNTRRLLLNNSLITNNQLLNTNYQNFLDHKLRDAKSLVMNSTLLVLTWSLLTLNMISSSQKLLPSSSSAINSPLASSSSATISTKHQAINQTELSSKTEDFTLVYSNIISGAIIFTFLFIYRLNLFKSFKCSSSSNCLFMSPYRKSGRSRCLIMSSSGPGYSSSNQSSARLGRFHSQTRSVLKFNQSSGNDIAMQNNGIKWLDHDNDTYPVASFGDSLFTGSQFSATSSSRRERLRLQQFNTYGTYNSSFVESNPGAINSNSDINPLTLHALASSFVASSKRSKSSKVRQQRGGLFDSTPTHDGSKNKPLKKRNKSPSLFFANSSSSGSSIPKSSRVGNENSKLQRRQSTNSVASSTAKLVAKDNNSMLDSDDMFDTLSCASSVASSSTSQLHGNDLYPIDCSIQPEVQLQQANNNTGCENIATFSGSGSFSRRSSLRRSMSKLTSVKEEYLVNNSREDSVKCDSRTTKVNDKTPSTINTEKAVADT